MNEFLHNKGKCMGLGNCYIMAVVSYIIHAFNGYKIFTPNGVLGASIFIVSKKTQIIYVWLKRKRQVQGMR